MWRVLGLGASHGMVGVAGFVAGIHVLPILTAPPAPAAAEVQALMSKATFTGSFRRDLAGSDALHWGAGEVSVGPDNVHLPAGTDLRAYDTAVIWCEACGEFITAARYR